MIYSYADYIDILLFINRNVKWNKKMDRKEGLEVGKTPFTSESSVSYRKTFRALNAEPFYESTTYD